MTQDYIPFVQIVVEIGKLCKQKATGTLFIATKANHSAQLVLDKGEIVFVFFSSKRGEEALTLMAAIREGRYRFQEGGVIPRRMDLPATEAILAMLERGAVGGPPARDSSPGKARDNSPARPQPAAGGSGLSGDQQEVLQACLAECIGPMAAIICEDHLGSAKPLAEIVDALAAEIPSPGQAKKFREMVAARLAA